MKILKRLKRFHKKRRQRAEGRGQTSPGRANQNPGRGNRNPGRANRKSDRAIQNPDRANQKVKLEALAAKKGSAAFWTVHTVVDDEFKSAEESLSYLDWRNAQYPGYADLMPVTDQDGKVVLDYGCGPGNDVVGFAVHSSPEKLIAVDVSKTALDKAARRLSLHGGSAEFIRIDEVENEIPIQSESVDFIHSSGVLHHCANLSGALKEFHRVLRPDGQLQVMVYNYQSLFLHLYIAYVLQVEMGKHQDLPVRDAFQKTADGGNCPIAHCYMPPEFVELMAKHGFRGHFSGAAISFAEMKLLPKRFDAMSNRRFPKEHRDFLADLTFDERGIPRYQGQVAGIDACYRFKKAG